MNTEQLNNVLLEGRWQVLWLMESNFHTMLHGHTAHSCFSICLHNETLRNRTAGSERKMGNLENCLYTRQVAADDCPSVALSGGGRSRMKREAEPAGPARHHGFGLKSECLYFHFTYITTRVKNTLRIGQTPPHLPRGHAWLAKGHMAQSSSKFVIRKQHPKVIKGNHCRHAHVDQRKSKPGMMAHVYKPSTRETEAKRLRVGDQLRQ